MIDKKGLNEYTNKELLEVLNSKKEIEAYTLFKFLYEENTKTNKYYSYFEEFLKMIYDKSSYIRMRGFRLCSMLAKWDKKKKIDKNLEKMLILLEDEKPTTIRIVLSCMKEILEYKPYLAKIIKKNLKRIDYSKYKDTMVPLIKKDIDKINKIIDSI